MKALWKKMTVALTAMFLLMPMAAFAAGGGGAGIVIVADTRKLTGVMAWWSNLYNESHLYFTLLTIVIIPTVGVIFGVLADIVMHFVGIDLKHRDLAEH
ncbi:DVU0150 family protein [Desulfolutivibrio sulfoxidireducens]|uniref:DVU0150 family protein n=1 Tax=Desulfolutivibrio sulfoxidireducens TaxID=2773299 RepID=UPI00159DB516|nr:DVU0150 family protein [Desulfolutivibrio sulfoxidireducens]